MPPQCSRLPVALLPELEAAVVSTCSSSSLRTRACAPARPQHRRVQGGYRRGRSRPPDAPVLCSVDGEAPERVIRHARTSPEEQLGESVTGQWDLSSLSPRRLLALVAIHELTTRDSNVMVRSGERRYGCVFLSETDTTVGGEVGYVRAVGGDSAAF